MAPKWFERLASMLVRRRLDDVDTRRVHEAFAERFGIGFRDPNLLRIALTHRSHLSSNDAVISNERMEFLGDSVLGLIASDNLFRALNDADEGTLTKARSRIVNKNVLGKVGMDLGVLDLLLYAREEIAGDDRALVTLSSDALEAIIGAIYLDRGFETAYRFVMERVIGSLGDTPSAQFETDYKSRLQEICQARFRCHPQYRIVKRMGPEHRKVFHVEAVIHGRTYGFGSGRSRKEAEQQAAGQAVRRFQKAGSKQAGADA